MGGPGPIGERRPIASFASQLDLQQVINKLKDDEIACHFIESSKNKKYVYIIKDSNNKAIIDQGSSDWWIVAQFSSFFKRSKGCILEWGLTARSKVIERVNSDLQSNLSVLQNLTKRKITSNFTETSEELSNAQSKIAQLAGILSSENAFVSNQSPDSFNAMRESLTQVASEIREGKELFTNTTDELNSLDTETFNKQDKMKQYEDLSLILKHLKSRQDHLEESFYNDAQNKVLKKMNEVLTEIVDSSPLIVNSSPLIDRRTLGEKILIYQSKLDFLERNKSTLKEINRYDAAHRSLLTEIVELGQNPVGTLIEQINFLNSLSKLLRGSSQAETFKEKIKENVKNLIHETLEKSSLSTEQKFQTLSQLSNRIGADAPVMIKESVLNLLKKEVKKTIDSDDFEKIEVAYHKLSGERESYLLLGKVGLAISDYESQLKILRDKFNEQMKVKRAVMCAPILVQLTHNRETILEIIRNREAEFQQKQAALITAQESIAKDQKALDASSPSLLLNQKRSLSESMIILQRQADNLAMEIREKEKQLTPISLAFREMGRSIGLAPETERDPVKIRQSEEKLQAHIAKNREIRLREVQSQQFHKSMIAWFSVLNKAYEKKYEGGVTDRQLAINILTNINPKIEFLRTMIQMPPEEAIKHADQTQTSLKSIMDVILTRDQENDVKTLKKLAEEFRQQDVPARLRDGIADLLVRTPSSSSTSPRTIVGGFRQAAVSFLENRPSSTIRLQYNHLYQGICQQFNNLLPKTLEDAGFLSDSLDESHLKGQESSRFLATIQSDKEMELSDLTASVGRAREEFFTGDLLRFKDHSMGIEDVLTPTQAKQYELLSFRSKILDLKQKRAAHREMERNQESLRTQEAERATLSAKLQLQSEEMVRVKAGIEVDRNAIAELNQQERILTEKINQVKDLESGEPSLENLESSRSSLEKLAKKLEAFKGF